MIVDIVGCINKLGCFGYVMMILYYFNNEINEKEMYQKFLDFGSTYAATKLATIQGSCKKGP